MAAGHGGNAISLHAQRGRQTPTEEAVEQAGTSHCRDPEEESSCSSKQGVWIVVTGFPSQCHGPVSLPVCLSVRASSGLQGSGELGQGPLVIDHSEVLNVKSDPERAPEGQRLLRTGGDPHSRALRGQSVAPTLLWGRGNVGLTPAVLHNLHSLCNHAHFLEVDQAVEVGLVALVNEGHVFEQQRYEGDGRGAKLGERQAVRPVIEGGVH